MIALNAMNEESHNAPTNVDPARWLEEHGDVLFRYAMQRLRNRDVAEDVVQDTFVAAIRAKDSFQGRASVQTWLVGILRRKIVDYIRRQSVERKAKGIREEAETEAASFFTSKGHWRKSVKSWPTNPQQSLENREMLQILRECCSKLSPPLSQAFQLREVDQLSTEEVCNHLDISPSNLGVRLHRARLLLRECLERNWFSPET
ncbi:MAG: sigma-70 family RNA polymerase sigma factor [Planctomycetales bacterium]|nr:sigma-70 family RNA polymerase sigma factor [Planctomycetales bacterium]